MVLLHVMMALVLSTSGGHRRKIQRKQTRRQAKASKRVDNHTNEEGINEVRYSANVHP